MASEWQDIQARIDALAALDRRCQAEGAGAHAYKFDAQGDGPDVDAWLSRHGDWLARELRVFRTVEDVFGLAPTMDDFRTGFLVREAEMPFAMRLCSYWNVEPPPQYKFEESDPEPGTVRYRWFEEQYKRQRTRHRFQGGLGGVMKMLPRRAKNRKG